jgi:hypothetical protein
MDFFWGGASYQPSLPFPSLAPLPPPLNLCLSLSLSLSSPPPPLPPPFLSSTFLSSPSLPPLNPYLLLLLLLSHPPLPSLPLCSSPLFSLSLSYKPTTPCRVIVRARVCVRRPAQRRARQAKGKRQNRYVIKVMKINREGDGFPWFARTKGSTKRFNWSIYNNLLYIYSTL